MYTMKHTTLLVVLISLLGSSLSKISFSSKKNDGMPKAIHPLSDEMIDHINQLKPLWKAGRNFPATTNMRYIRRLMGALEEPWYLRLPQKTHRVEGLHIPTEFDARTKWPNCPSIKEIRDQGSCGSCWAFSITETMTDRYCIGSKGTKQFRFSAENLVACCPYIFCGLGCNGGVMSTAWRYFERHGIVSGGPYGSNEGCQPYEIPPCEHHMSGERVNCTMPVNTPQCHKVCQPNYPVTYANDLHYVESSYSLPRDIEQIQIEIMKNGPVTSSFYVYEDFVSYKSGIYHHVAGKYIGGHAIKIIGWGEENGTAYWTIANSWNYDFGEKGFFRIRRGHNECGLENAIKAGIPKII